MHIVVLGQEARYQAYRPAMPFLDRQTPAFLDKDSTEAEIAAASPEAEVLFVDAITPVTASLMDRLPKLRLIHSEGVAYDRIDLDRAVRAGRQMEMKERYMVEGITELSACKVGLVGFGDIGRATAERLAPFGCELYYYTRHRRAPEEERKYGVTYLPLEELAAACDIVSLHCAVTDETRNMVDEDFLARMKPTAYLINTARGDLVDNEALARALTEGRIAGAGLDTLAPEPVPAGHPLTVLPPEVQDRVALAPHLGGITEAAFRRAHAHMWRNAERLAAGERPDCVVNGL